MARTTVILGTVYRGRPKMGSGAFRVWSLEQDGKRDEAERHLNALRMMGRDDLQADMTDLPMEGMEVYPALRVEPLTELKRTGTGGYWS